MKVGRSVIARISATAISTLSVPMPGRHDRDPLAPVRPGGRRELAVPVLHLDRVEARGDPGGPILVTGEEDVLGQVARAESDVVLPVPFGDRDPAIAGVSTRVSAFGKTSPRSCGVLRWRETRPRIVPRFSRASSRVDARSSPCVGHAQAHAQRHAQPPRVGRAPPAGRRRPARDRRAGQPAGHPTLPSRRRAWRRRSDGHGDRRDADQEHRRQPGAGPRQAGDRVAEAGGADRPRRPVAGGRRRRARRWRSPGRPRSAPRTTAAGSSTTTTKHAVAGLDACRSTLIASPGSMSGEQVRGLAGQDDRADGRAVVEREAVGPQVLDETADAHGRARRSAARSTRSASATPMARPDAACRVAPPPAGGRRRSCRAGAAAAAVPRRGAGAESSDVGRRCAAGRSGAGRVAFG